MKVYFFSFAYFSEYLESLQNLRWERVLATKMPYLMFFETKMIYFKIFMGILSETLYLLLVF